MLLKINHQIYISDKEIEYVAIRAQGAGGQNVNKVSTAVHLRFNIHSSSLPEWIKRRLLNSNDKRVSKQGIIVIKSQTTRSLDKNKELALVRLTEMIKNASSIRKPRIETRPTKRSQQRRLDHKAKHGQLKKLRHKISHSD